MSKIYSTGTGRKTVEMIAEPARQYLDCLAVGAQRARVVAPRQGLVSRFDLRLGGVELLDTLSVLVRTLEHDQQMQGQN